MFLDVRSVFRGSRVHCVFDRRGRDRPHASVLDSELVLESDRTAWLALTRRQYSAQTMLSAGDVAPNGARNATLILLQQMQRCTDSMKPE